jgi:hypothetical protein
MANDVAFFEFAQGLAMRAQRETAEPVRREFLLANCRLPSAKDEAVLQRYFEAQVRAFTADPAAAQAMLPKAIPANADPISTAALVGTARAILNSDSFITRE